LSVCPAHLEAPIVFSLASLDEFAKASHDINPLHMSEAYARSTPFGKRVVHGMLAAIVCLGRLPRRPDERIARVEVDFKAALFVDVPYRLDVATVGRRVTARLYDGRRWVLRLVLDLVEGGPSSVAPLHASGLRAESARLGLADLHEGWECQGSYGEALGGLDAVGRYAPRLLEVGVGPSEVAILMASSWLVGMNVPGERALFSRAVIEFEGDAATHDSALAYRLVVTDRDDRFDLIGMEATFTLGHSIKAKAHLESFVRADPQALDAHHLRALSPPGSALAERTAVVIGGSRGLGAAIVLALADQGCQVGLVFAQSREAAERVARLSPQNRITLLQVDATDSSALEPATHRFALEHGGLDFLVCNACPSLRAISLDPASVSRIVSYVAESVAMVAVPVAVTLDLLEARRGALVTISSSAVNSPPSGWSHYVTAKAAIEGFHKATLAQTRGLRGLVVRPPRLRTDLVNTPGSHEPALAPEVVAANLIEALAGLDRDGASVLEHFRDATV
jgi:NAD(P)-dependent dehydrogenase (short-subunit alcohol dehydrogenase family)